MKKYYKKAMIVKIQGLLYIFLYFCIIVLFWTDVDETPLKLGILYKKYNLCVKTLTLKHPPLKYIDTIQNRFRPKKSILFLITRARH